MHIAEAATCERNIFNLREGRRFVELFLVSIGNHHIFKGDGPVAMCSRKKFYYYFCVRKTCLMISKYKSFTLTENCALSILVEYLHMYDMFLLTRFLVRLGLTEHSFL